MRLLKAIFKRPVTIVFAILVAIILGVLSTSNMAVNLLPDISLPYLAVQTIYPGADAETIDKEVTLPLEKVLSQINGIHESNTYSLDNASIIMMQFDYGTNIESKENDIQNKLDGVSLPEGCKNPSISKIDLNSTSMFSMSVFSNGKSMEETYYEAEKIKDELSTISGAGSIKLSGAPLIEVRIDTINGLEMFVGKLVNDLKSEASLDIPLGDIHVDGDKITINNHSKAETIEEIKNTTIGLELSNTYISTFKATQEVIEEIEDMNLEELESMKEDADSMNEFIDKLESSSEDELRDLTNNLEVIKSLVETIEGNSSGGLKLMWSQILKNLFEDETFQNLTDDELQEMSNKYGVPYGLLKWAQDNAEIDGDSNKTYAEIKWNKIVLFREAHPETPIDNEYYPSLFYDIELLSNDENDEDYMKEEDIVKAIDLARNINVAGLRSVTNTLIDGKEVTNNQYASMFAYINNGYSIPLNGFTIQMIRDSHFESNYQVFYEYKSLHQTEYWYLDDETYEDVYVFIGDPIPSEDFMDMYSKMSFDEELELPPTVRLIDFVRDVDFTSNSVKFKVEQMADVYLSTTYETSAYYNMNQAIQIDIFGTNNSNATAVANDAKKIISKYNSSHNDYQVIALNSQADFINDSLSNALVSLLIGMFLAIIVIYLFLRKVKSSLIIAISMPISVLMTLCCLYLMGITLNMVSVGGIAVGIGMLVDNSIVVLESITSEKEKGKDVLQASISGVKLVLGSLIGSTLTSICVFFPILFINGLTKEIFADLAWAVIFSLSFSLLVAITVIPTLFCFLYKDKGNEEIKTEKKNKFFEKLDNWYIGVLGKILKHKGVTIIAALGVFLASIGLVFTCPIEFLPSIDQHKVQVNINFGVGLEDNYCQEKTLEAYKLIMDNLDDIDHMSESVGFTSLIETNRQGVITIQLKDNAKSSKNVCEDIRELFTNNKYSEDYSVVEQDGVVASLFGGISGVSISIRGENVETLKEIASKVEKEVITKKGIKHASDNMLSESKSYSLIFDQDAVVENGLDYPSLVQTLRVGLSGYEIYEINNINDKTSVRVSWTNGTIGDYYSSLAKFVIGAKNEDGELKFVHLEDVCKIQEENGRHIIRKSNGKNVLTIDIESYGIDTNTASRTLQSVTREVLKDYDGYSFDNSGISAYLVDAFQGLFIALIISFFLLFGVMACLFESFRKPFIIIFSFPFAFAGGFLILALTRVSLNVVSFIGFIMLMGVIINDAIVLNERFDQLKNDENMDPRNAVIEGCRQRLRAVLMTTLTTVLALIPMALGLGKGGELMQPLGIVAIGGMTIGTLVTLIIIPCAYSLMYKISYKEEKKKNDSK